MLRRAVTHLKRSDPVMANIVARVGPCRFKTRSGASAFEVLTSAIISQQVSGAAAAAIRQRVYAVFADRPPEPAQLLEVSDPTLRAAGLSRQKIAYLQDLARHAVDGALPFDQFATMPDEEIIRALVAVKGIGRWTAQMFLMFQLGRPDVLPELDLGIRMAVKRAYRLRQPPDVRRLQRIGAAWAPYRTIASWYLWRSLDGEAAI
ncbi:MAG: DNA-3-methyladenine glycosylase 2 family protein [Gemmatimonadaceae bacterium]